MAHILINLELRAWDNLRGVLSVLNAKQLILAPCRTRVGATMVATWSERSPALNIAVT